MSGQRARSAVAADHRSALPHIPGLPWWGAVLLAVTATAVGFAFDAGSGTKTLTAAFTVCYVTGCVLAVLAVRQSGVFSTVIQPPLILFVAVPSANFVFHRSEIQGIKDVLINCGYPLIERFPLMFLTAATVLIIGMLRWYLGTSTRHGTASEDAAADESADGTVAATSKTTTAKATARRSRRQSVPRPIAEPTVDEDVSRPARRPRTTAAGPSRSRHARPPETEIVEPVATRPRRTRPPVDPPVEPRRRPRAADEARERRNLPPVERRSSAQDRAERRPQRPDRYDGPQRRERPDRPERPQRRGRMPDYEPFESPVNGASTHHPVSRVRYRGADDGDSRVEQRTRPRRPRDADSWE